MQLCSSECKFGSAYACSTVEIQLARVSSVSIGMRAIYHAICFCQKNGFAAFRQGIAARQGRRGQRSGTLKIAEGLMEPTMFARRRLRQPRCRSTSSPHSPRAPSTPKAILHVLSRVARASLAAHAVALGASLSALRCPPRQTDPTRFCSVQYALVHAPDPHESFREAYLTSLVIQQPPLTRCSHDASPRRRDV